MELIISQETVKLQTLQQEISVVHVELEQHKDVGDFSVFNDKILGNIDKLETSIMQIKKAKFKMDRED